MIAPDAVAELGDFEPGARQQRQKNLRVIDLAVAVGDAGEVERGLLQAERSRFEALPIPEQLQYPQASVRWHGGANLAQDRDDLLFGEAIQQLAHPDQFIALRQGVCRVQQIDWMAADAIE